MDYMFYVCNGDIKGVVNANQVYSFEGIKAYIDSTYTNIGDANKKSLTEGISNDIKGINRYIFRDCSKRPEDTKIIVEFRTSQNKSLINKVCYFFSMPEDIPPYLFSKEQDFVEALSNVKSQGVNL